MPDRPTRSHDGIAVHAYTALMARYGGPLKPVAFVFPESWLEPLSAAAQARGVTRSELGRQIVEAWLVDEGVAHACAVGAKIASQKADGRS